MLVRAVAVLAALLPGACTGAPGPARDAAPTVPQALVPFADACAFLPPGFDSLSFDRFDAESGPGSRRCLRARVGSDFRPPKGVGVGDYRGVEVIDFGGGGLPADVEGFDDPAVLARAPTDTVLGIAVWRYAENEPMRYTPERWVARVEGRFYVWSSDRALLARALARRGSLLELLRPFPAVRELPGDVTSVVCTLPRADDASYWSRPVPIETVVAYVDPTPPRVTLLHRRSLPGEYLAWTEHYPNAGLTTTSAAGWSVTSWSLQDDPTLTQLFMELLFGLAIFI